MAQKFLTDVSIKDSSNLFVDGKLKVGDLNAATNLLHVKSADADTLARFTSGDNLAKIIVEDNDTQAIVGASDHIAYFGPIPGATETENIRLDSRAGRGNGGYAAYGQTPNEAYKFRVSAGTLNTSTDANYAAISARIQGTGSDSLSDDRYLRGLHIDVDSDATGGDTSNEFRIYGGEINVKDTGDADLLYGLYVIAENEKTSALDNVTTVAAARMHANIDNTAGTVTNSHGVYGSVRADGSGTKTNMYAGRFEVSGGTCDSDITNLYGVWGKIDPGSNYTGTISTARGLYGEVEIETGSTFTNSWAVQAVVDHNGGTATNAAQFRGSSSGTIGTSYGIYSTGAAINRLDGKLSVNTLADPTDALNVGGDATFTGAVKLSGGGVINDTGSLTIQNNAGAMVNIKSNQGVRLYIDKNNDDTTHLFQILANTDTYDANSVVASVSQLGNATFAGNISANNLSGTNTGDQDLSGYLTTSFSDYVSKANGGTFSGNVGIGTTLSGSFYPGTHNLVVGDGSGEHAVTVYSGDDTTGYLLFADGTSGNNRYRGQVRYDHNTDSLEFATNGSSTTKLTINSSGNATFASDVQADNIGLGAAAASFGSGVPTLFFKGTNSTNGRAGALYFKENDGTETSALYSTNGDDGYGTVLCAYQGDLKFATGSLTGTKLTIASNGNATFAGDATISGGNLEIDSTMSSSPTSIIYLDVDGSNHTGGGGSLVFSTSASAGTLTNYNAQIRGVRASGGDGGDSQLEFWTTLVSDQITPQRRMYITKEGDVVIEKNLTVNGTTTTLNTTTVEVEDNILQLNTTQGSPDTATAATSGISVYRGDGVTQASFIFDDGDDTWDLTNNLKVAGQVLVKNDNGLRLNDTADSTTSRTTLSSATNGGNSKMLVKGGNFLHNVDFETSKNDFKYANLKASYNGGTSELNLYQSNSDTTSTAAITTISTGDSVFAGNVVLGDSSNTTMAVGAPGQLKVKGSGYTGAVALDATAMYIYHDSSLRDLVLGTNETARLTIAGSNGNATFAGTLTTAGIITVNGGTENLLGSFVSTDSIAEIRIQDNTAYTRLLNVGSQFKIMPNDGSETLILDGSDDSATFAGKIIAEKGVNYTGGTIAQATAVLHTNNILYFRGGSSGFYLQNGDGSDGYYISPTYHKWEVDSSESMRLTSTGLGIGTTTPTAPLHIEGGTNSEVLKIEADSNPFVRWVENGTNVGFLQFLGDHAYLSNMSNGSFFFRTNNTDKMTIQSGGNVGIGTTSPNQDGFGSAATVLSIKAKASGGSANTELIGLGNNDNDQVGMIGFMSQSATSPLATIRGLRHTSDTSGKLTFDTAGSEKMRIDQNGNVGIGLTDIKKSLEIEISNSNNVVTSGNSLLGAGSGAGVLIRNSNTTTNSYANLDFRANNADGRIAYQYKGATNQGDFHFITDNTSSPISAMVIKNDGKIGIGTTSPIRKFVVSNAGASGIEIQPNYTAGVNEILSFDRTSGATAYETMRFNGGGFQFQIGGTEKMRITPVGNVGIGTTNPVDNYASGVTGDPTKLAVLGGTSTGYTEVAHFAAGSDSNDTGATVRIGHIGNDRGMFIKAGRGTSDQAKALLGVRTSSNTDETVLTMQQGGNVGIGTTSPTYDLSVAGGIEAGGKVTYSKSYGSLNTTGNAVAGLTTGSNGNSAGFTFTCYGHGGYQKVVYSCFNVSGTWNTVKAIDEGTNVFDIEASANGSTITFTFKTRSGTKQYTPRVTIEATGHSINSTYA